MAGIARAGERPEVPGAVAFLRRFPDGATAAAPPGAFLIRFKGYDLSPHRAGTPSDAVVVAEWA